MAYRVTNFLTGANISEHLPLTGVKFDDTLGAGGSLTGNLPIDYPGFGPDLRDYLTRIIIWPCLDGQPLGAYVLIGAPTVSLDSVVQPIVAHRVDSEFKFRPILDDLVFTGVDQLSIARDLFRYGVGQHTLSTDVPRVYPASISPWAVMPWLRLDTTLSGVLRDRTKIVDGQEDDGYRGKARKPVADMVNNLCDLENGFEYRMDYGADPDTANLWCQITFGYPLVGRPADDAGALVFEYPGGNIVSGTYGADANNYATRVDVVGGTVADVVRVGVATNSAAMRAGFPLRVAVQSSSNATGQADLDARAAGSLTALGRIHDGFALELDGNTDPVFGSYRLGDSVTLRIERGGSGVLVERVVRIVGWSIVPSDSGDGLRVTPTFAEG